MTLVVGIMGVESLAGRRGGRPTAQWQAIGRGDWSEEWIGRCSDQASKGHQYKSISRLWGRMLVGHVRRNVHGRRRRVVGITPDQGHALIVLCLHGCTMDQAAQGIQHCQRRDDHADQDREQ